MSKSVCSECGGWSGTAGAIAHFALCGVGVIESIPNAKMLEIINATRDDIKALACPGCKSAGTLLSWAEPTAVAAECVNCMWRMSLDRPNSELSS